MALSSLISAIPSTSKDNIFSESLKYCYQIYGFTIRSELALPQLLTGVEQSPTDVIVRYGPLPDFLENPVDEGPTWQSTQDEFLLTVLGVARYWICQGKEIWIERDPQADAADVRTFLLGSAMGILLHQRKIWALHASAIKTEQGAVLFTGLSGAGKSTTLNGFLMRGYSMVADDVSGIIIDDQKHPQVLSAFPHSRLWADTATYFGLSTEGVPRVRQSLEKFLFPVKNFAAGSVPLHTVYALIPHNKPEFEFTPINNVGKFACLISNTYRGRLVQSVGWGTGQFHLITQALQSIRVVSIRRPKQGFLLDELVDRIEEDFLHG